MNDDPEQEYSYEPESEDKQPEMKISKDTKCKDFVRSITSDRQVFCNYRQEKKMFETPLEKLQRLQHEVELFESDLKIMTSDDAISEKSSKISVNIKNIEKDLSSVLNDSRIAPHLPKDTPLNKVSISGQDSEISGALIDQLRDISSRGEGMEFNLHAHEATASNKMRLIELDRQIGALEKKIGCIDNVEELGFSEINNALSSLYRKLELLDGHKLESTKRRIGSLSTDHELIEGSLPKFRGTKASETKFNELYSHMQKWNKCILELPHFVARLESQVSVHKKHADALIRMQKLQRQQLALNNLLMEDRNSLNDANESLGKNLAIMNGNIKNFKKRFAELKKKIKKC